MADKTTRQPVSLKELCQTAPYGNALQSYFYTHGVITAVAACPEIPMPEQWMPWVLKPKSHKLNDTQKDNIAHALITALQSQLKRMTDEKMLLPDETAFTDTALRKTDELCKTNSALSLWCSGILAGHSQLETTWASAWDKMMEQAPEELTQRQRQLTHVLSMLSTFADVPMAIKQAEKKGNLQLKAHLPAIARALPNTIKEYVALSGSLVSYLENQFETFIKPQSD
jgi:uncharacterized protein